MSDQIKKPAFKMLGTVELPDFEKITSVMAAAFDKNLNILTVNLKKRGIDIPGGHVEREDSTIYDTVEREVREEACAELENNLKVSAVIESDYYKCPTYMVVLAGRVKRLDKFKETDEVISREFMSVEDFLEKYEYDKELMKKIIKRSLLKIDDNSKDNKIP